jgi:hypothetical protein
VLLAHLFHVDHKLGLVTCQIQICVLLDLEGWLRTLVVVQIMSAWAKKHTSWARSALRSTVNLWIWDSSFSDSSKVACVSLSAQVQL